MVVIPHGHGGGVCWFGFILMSKFKLVSYNFGFKRHDHLFNLVKLVQPTWELGWNLSQVELKSNAREVLILLFHILFLILKSDVLE